MNIFFGMALYFNVKADCRISVTPVQDSSQTCLEMDASDQLTVQYK